jgi:hypothetical protein
MESLPVLKAPVNETVQSSSMPPPSTTNTMGMHGLPPLQSPSRLEEPIPLPNVQTTTFGSDKPDTFFIGSHEYQVPPTNPLPDVVSTSESSVPETLPAPVQEPSGIVPDVINEESEAVVRRIQQERLAKQQEREREEQAERIRVQREKEELDRQMALDMRRKEEADNLERLRREQQERDEEEARRKQAEEEAQERQRLQALEAAEREKASKDAVLDVISNLEGDPTMQKYMALAKERRDQQQSSLPKRVPEVASKVKPDEPVLSDPVASSVSDIHVAAGDTADEVR